jgi:hypothetical protein
MISPRFAPGKACTRAGFSYLPAVLKKTTTIGVTDE